MEDGNFSQISNSYISCIKFDVDISCMSSFFRKGLEFNKCIRYESCVVVLSFVFRYIQRRNLLQLLKPDDLTLLETAPKRWTSLESPRGEERISGNLSLSSPMTAETYLFPAYYVYCFS